MSRIWLVGLKCLGFRRFIVFRVIRFGFLFFNSRALGFQEL